MTDLNGNQNVVTVCEDHYSYMRILTSRSKSSEVDDVNDTRMSHGFVCGKCDHTSRVGKFARSHSGFGVNSFEHFSIRHIPKTNGVVSGT